MEVWGGDGGKGCCWRFIRRPAVYIKSSQGLSHVLCMCEWQDARWEKREGWRGGETGQRQRLGASCQLKERAVIKGCAFLTLSLFHTPRNGKHDCLLSLCVSRTVESHSMTEQPDLEGADQRPCNPLLNSKGKGNLRGTCHQAKDWWLASRRKKKKKQSGRKKHSPIDRLHRALLPCEARPPEANLEKRVLPR